MDLRTLTKNAQSAARARARMLREGITPSGHKVWSEEEDLAWAAAGFSDTELG